MINYFKSFIKKKVFIIVFCLTMGLANNFFGQSHTDGNNYVLIILDCSESMGFLYNGTKKLDIAKEVIVKMLKANPHKHYALMLYGSGIRSRCEDVDLAISFRNGNTNDILKRLSTVKPYGTSPLSAAVKKGIKLLNNYPEPKTILLLSDGLDNCNTPIDKLIPALISSKISLNAVFINIDVNEQYKTKILNLLHKKQIVYYTEKDDYKKLISSFSTENEVVETLKNQTKKVFKSASLIKNQDLKPKYPYFAKRYGLEGKVTVGINIDKTGSVSKVSIIKSSNYELLDQAAINTVKKWKFYPAKLNNIPVKDYKKKILVFSLLDEED